MLKVAPLGKRVRKVGIGRPRIVPPGKRVRKVGMLDEVPGCAYGRWDRAVTIKCSREAGENPARPPPL